MTHDELDESPERYVEMTCRDGEHVRLTRHAADRAREMSVTIADVARVLNDPEVTYDQPWRGSRSRIYQRGDLAVAAQLNAAGEPVALTVLRRTAERYEREEQS